MNKQTSDKVEASATPIQKQKPIDLSLDLVQVAVGEYVTQQAGEEYVIRTGKRKGQKDKRRNSKIALPTVKALKDANIANPEQVQANRGRTLMHSATAMMNRLDRDDRMICYGITHALDNQGMARMVIGVKQTTAQKLLASLLAHGVPPKEARKIADKWE